MAADENSGLRFRRSAIDFAIRRMSPGEYLCVQQSAKQNDSVRLTYIDTSTAIKIAAGYLTFKNFITTEEVYNDKE